LGRARHGDAGGWVDDGNGIATSGGGGLVKLEARMLVVVAGRDEGGGSGVEREARSDGLRLLSRRRVRGVAG